MSKLKIYKIKIPAGEWHRVIKGTGNLKNKNSKMKYLEQFENFQLNELEEITPSLRKSLDSLKIGFDNEEDVVEAILKLGFKRKPSTVASGKTGDYVFYDPSQGTTYTSSTMGYVRSYRLGKFWLTNKDVIRKTPISRSELKDPMDRLLLILRRALKIADLYNDWKKTNLTVKEFLEKSSNILTAKKYGI